MNFTWLDSLGDLSSFLSSELLGEAYRIEDSIIDDFNILYLAFDVIDFW